jgi:signal transduction histidine kinase
MAAVKILIVEDEIVVARDLENQLRALGYVVSGTAASGEEAVTLAKQAAPDLVLMDIRLQGRLDGIAAADEIRKRLQLPVVYLTAHADDSTVRRARATEPFGYLLKPFEERELRITLEMALYKHRAERERKHLEEQLFQAQKMESIGRLAGGVAHDFNNLLTAINGNCSLLLRSMAADHPWREIVEDIFRAGERAAELTRQLLAFSRKQLLQPRVLDLNAVVTGMKKMLARIIGETIVLKTELQADLGPVRADQGQMEQVILNLTFNARDAMPEGGTLTLATAEVELGEKGIPGHPEIRPGHYRRLTVTDTGHGMDAAVRERIFEPFFTTKELGKGTGMGLAMVYGIVKQSDGHILVQSMPGSGTTFSIYLPAAARDTAAPVPAPTNPVLAGGTETILLVEDEHSVRITLRRVLSLCGYTVLEARHGHEANQLSERHAGHIDLLISDVQMPQLGGPDLARLLRQNRPDLKVLFISGYGDNRLVAQSGAGGDPFLQKPFTPEALTAKVREALDGKATAVR